MEPVTEALQLLKRQAELEAAMRAPGGIRITEERELHALRARLRRLPHATRAIAAAAHSFERPISALTAEDVESWLNPAGAQRAPVR